MLATFLIVSAGSWAWLMTAKARDDAALVPAWFDLWERCRTSIEERLPLNTSGLVPAIVEVDPASRGVGEEDRLQRWSPVNIDRFVIEETEKDTNAGSLRACQVILADWRKPLSRVEMARLTYAFLEQRSALMVKGTHEARDPSPLFGVTSSGFGPTTSNAASCPVISVTFSTPKDGWFRSMTAEQGLHCDGGPSLLYLKK